MLLTQNWLSPMSAGFTLSRGITDPRLLIHYPRDKRGFLLPPCRSDQLVDTASYFCRCLQVFSEEMGIAVISQYEIDWPFGNDQSFRQLFFCIGTDHRAFNNVAAATNHFFVVIKDLLGNTNGCLLNGADLGWITLANSTK